MPDRFMDQFGYGLKQGWYQILYGWDEHKLVAVIFTDSPKSEWQMEGNVIVYWCIMVDTDGSGENYQRFDGCENVGGFIGQSMGLG
ncbi:hypothetical protein N7517_005208 [Penicillium concentricum]|uniref:Uncharacterized protein n=1 Tax=Penicillium concentricum TaxID=293559 RepID=A0A9W9S7Q7_9EURO|nr:uncharacterized protein N7517_005208 [Penicillium concentricum]KAJ5373202.1 hypothetical protein N7517_005208 [Penicillium concentricum]